MKVARHGRHHLSQDLSAADTSTVTITDDVAVIRLSFSKTLIRTDATGLFGPPGVTHGLVVTGLIENVIGSDSADYIIGKEANNRLYGDNKGNGLGDNCTPSGGSDRGSLYGGKADDDLTGGDGDDRPFGDSGDDTTSDTVGRDTIAGGAGTNSPSPAACALADAYSDADGSLDVFILLQRVSTLDANDL